MVDLVHWIAEIKLSQREISLSVVSHGQADLIRQLLEDLDRTGAANQISEILVTVNVPEEHQLKLVSAPLKLVNNERPQGFGKNHNSAFKHSTGKYFCVINPDIRLERNPFPALVHHLKITKTAIVGPRVVNSSGDTEDSARPFPRSKALIKKLMGRKQSTLYPDNNIPDSPDWVAGMFMLFDSRAFKEVGGFNERYFLYYEDADICARFRSAGWDVAYCRDAEVIHDARRDSHRKLRYLKWHVSSMIRFLTSSAYRAVRKR